MESENRTPGSFEINKKFLGNFETYFWTLGSFEIILKNVGIFDISLSMKIELIFCFVWFFIGKALSSHQRNGLRG